MLEPLKQFVCDTCGGIIEDVNDGWLEWEGSIENDELINKNFRICHHNNSCQKLSYHRHCSDLPLKEAVGDNAHAFLFSFLDIGPYHSQVYTKPSVFDYREYTELMRRLTIPFYEEARIWWNEAMNDGYFVDSNSISIYLPQNLKRMIEHYSETDQ